MNIYEYGADNDIEAITYLLGSGDDETTDESNVTDIYGTDIESEGDFDPENMPGSGRPGGLGGQGGFGGDRPGGSGGHGGRPGGHGEQGGFGGGRPGDHGGRPGGHGGQDGFGGGRPQDGSDMQYQNYL